MSSPDAAPETPPTVGELVRRAAAERPDDLALVDGPTRLSWSELLGRMDAAAAGFVHYELEPGDRVALQAPTSADFVVSYLGALQAGLVVVPVNPGYTIPELSYILSDSGARMLIAGSVAAVEAAHSLREEHPALEHVLVAARSGADDLPTVGDVLEVGASLPPVRRDRTGEDLAVLLYTSGTSGHPKGAMLPVRALLTNLAQFAALQPAPVSASDRLYLPLPLFHVFGLNAGLGLALYFGATVILASRFDQEEGLVDIRTEGATVVIGAPLEFELWAAQPEFRAAVRSVRFALSGSAPLPPELVAEYAEAGVALFEGYGLTEAAPVVTLNLFPSAELPEGWSAPKAGSIGRALPGVEVCLIDADSEPVEPGDLGILAVRGANLFTGYWPDGEGGPDPDGWFVTGDVAVADDDGDYYLVGRRSDLILVNGFNVYPAEVEAVFSKLEGVHEVAVVGESDVVVAYVVPIPGAALDHESLIQHASRSLARFKLPERIIEVATLPHTATGKVMKWRLQSGRADR